MLLNKSQFPNPINAAKKVGNYIGNVYREARDIPTAIGTGMWSSFEQQNSGPATRQTNLDNAIKSNWNTRRQVKDVFQAIGGQTGQSRSDQYDAKGNYVSGSKLTNPSTKKK